MIRVTTSLLLLSSLALAQPQNSLSIYQDDFALVKDRRTVELTEGVSELRLTDLPATLEPPSVRVVAPDNPEFKVVEQNFEFDLVGAARLMQKYVGHEVRVITNQGEMIEGTLLVAENDRIVLKSNGGLKILTLKTVQSVRLDKLPENLVIKPTLVWQLYSPAAGPQAIQLSYIARQIGWNADYNVVLNEDETRIDLTGLVTIKNESGKTYEQADVKLIAGIGRTDQPATFLQGIEYLRAVEEIKPTGQRGDETAEVFGDYRLYRLDRPTTVLDNQVKQITLITAQNVPVRKTYLYDGGRVRFVPGRVYEEPGFGREENTKVNVLLAIRNTADDNLGVALPGGKVRVFKRDVDQSLEFVGEDVIPGTAVDERILVYVGDAFDVTGSRTQTDFQRPAATVIEEAFEIVLKNHKQEPIEVTVIEKLYRWSDWEMLESSHDYTKLDSRTIKFQVPVEADGKATVTYRIRYTW
ncbi:MAG: DUF4139 domain-containing protein [Phycisphaerae bacterium]|nr:DUF4139 domain-containing protein [Phycisphaerae bacterium]